LKDFLVNLGRINRSVSLVFSDRDCRLYSGA
jgi:hypothetical protein